jgi:hypothetical protein
MSPKAMDRRSAPEWPAGGLGAAPIVGALALGFVVAHLAGARLPLVNSDRDAFFALLILGWLGCMAGAGSTIQALGWRHPICLAGMSIGLAGLAFIGLALLRVAGIHTDRGTIAALGAVFGIKWALSLAADALSLRAAETSPSA